MISVVLLRHLRNTVTAFAALPMLASGQSAPAIDSSPPAALLKVYLDCRTGGCDRELFATDLRFATLTRDRADADVHLLVTGLGNGGGGRQLTLQFIGLRQFEGRTDTLVTSLTPSIAEDRVRREILRVAKLGLAPYAMRTTAAAGLRLDDSGIAVAQRESQLRTNDPWNAWVISISMNSGANAESQSSRANLGGGLSVRRITDAWKVNFSSNGNYRQSSYELSDGGRESYILRDYGSRGRVVRSAGAHWSTGIVGNIGHTDYANQDLYARFGATFEYNLFPWKEATARELVAAYQVAVQHLRYHEITIYDKDRETLPHQSIIVAGSTRQPWGTLELRTHWSQYLTDLSKSNLGVEAEASLRVARGLSINIRGFATRVRDQLYLPRGSATDEEILTQQRALATSFVRGGSLSVSYTFGSIYNTIVNPRLDVMGGY